MWGSRTSFRKVTVLEFATPDEGRKPRLSAANAAMHSSETEIAHECSLAMLRPLLLILFSTGIVPAQTPAAGGVVAAGYDVPPTRISVAPGQVITFFVHGIGLGLSGPVRASSGQWPTTLGGISANFVQSGTTPVPLLSVEPITTCDNPSPGCGSYTAVTLQVPFGIAATNPGASILGGPPPFGTIQFVENGTVQSGVEVTTYVDQIHLLRYCDLLFSLERRLPNRSRRT